MAPRSIADDESDVDPDDWWSQASVLGVEQDPQSGAYVLTSVQVRGEAMTLAAPCPVSGEELGDLNNWTRVVELRIDCQDAELSNGH